MYKLILPTLLLILMGCSENELTNLVSDKYPDAHVVKNRTIEEAAEIANQLLANGITITRNNADITLNPKPHIVSSKMSRSQNSDTLLYAFDLVDKNGFILIAAPKNVEPIMAVVETGSFEDVSSNNTPAFQTTFDLMTNYVYMSSRGEDGLHDWTINPTLPTNPHVSMRIIRNWEPSVEVVWGQRWPEGFYAPNKLAGCVPLAIGMALSVFEKPYEITYTFVGRDLDKEKLDWREIKKHKQSSGFYSGCEVCSVSDDATHNTIGRLIRQIGEIVKVNYSKNPYVTTATTGSAEGVISQFANRTPDDKRGARYSNKPGTIDSLYNRLTNNAGVAIVDYGSKENLGMGHAFIADAVQIVRYYYIDGSPLITTDDVKMIHYNWGDAGSCNGWYYLDAVNPDDAYSYDFGEIENEYMVEGDVRSLQYWYYKL